MFSVWLESWIRLGVMLVTSAEISGFVLFHFLVLYNPGICLGYDYFHLEKYNEYCKICRLSMFCLWRVELLLNFLREQFFLPKITKWCDRTWQNTNRRKFLALVVTDFPPFLKLFFLMCWIQNPPFRCFSHIHLLDKFWCAATWFHACLFRIYVCTPNSFLLLLQQTCRE